jgi:hypothetical protein
VTETPLVAAFSLIVKPPVAQPEEWFGARARDDHAAGELADVERQSTRQADADLGERGCVAAGEHHEPQLRFALRDSGE